MRRKLLSVRLASVAAVAAGWSAAQSQCQFYLAQQADFNTNVGFTLTLEASTDSTGVCQLSSMRMRLSAGDGTQFRHVDMTPSWQTGMIYTVAATITAGGPQRLALNGGTASSLTASFRPAQTNLFGSLVANSNPAAQGYIVTQASLDVSNGSENSISLRPNGANAIPMPLMLLAGAAPVGSAWTALPVPWQTTFADDAAQSTTVTVSFRLDNPVSNLRQYDPYIDAYGQAACTGCDWPGKVKTDADLQARIADEASWFAANPPIVGTKQMDQYGGSTVAGWNDKSPQLCGTIGSPGYYHAACYNNHWYLISPLGNPLFYVGLTGVYDNYTPLTSRTSVFAPPTPQSGDCKSDPYGLNVWGGEKPDTCYISFDISNQMRKYGSTWSRDLERNKLVQRLASWGFTGVGKEGGVTGLPRSPILQHDGVPNLVAGGHPDVWDSAVLGQLRTRLAASDNVGAHVTDPYIVGWSVGNENKEIVQSSEITAILAVPGPAPAGKKALVDYALQLPQYGGSVSRMAAAWKITAATKEDIYNSSKAVPPDADVAALRRYYEDYYYTMLRETVAGIDPNHLYFGSWIVAGPGAANDWAIAAAHVDVLGFDDFSAGPINPDFNAFLLTAKKPAMMGAFSFPADYGGMRGFGWGDQYTQATTYSDSDSGDSYAQRIQSARENPYMVGLEWFEYRDEPVSGRGNTDGSSYAAGTLVVGEDHAFGLVDITDTPKYDLVNKIRAANLATMQFLKLTSPAPSVTSGSAANGATYLAGGLVPGSWAQVKGATLSNSPVTWDSFFGSGNSLPTNLDGTEVKVNGAPAAVYYAAPTQVNFQVPDGVTGTASVQVFHNGTGSNIVTAQAALNSPGIFPIILNGTNYAAGVFLDGKIVGDPANGPAYRNAKPGEVIQLFATGLVATPAGVLATPRTVSGVTVTIGGVTVAADYAGLAYAGEFQINFTVPQQFASRASGNYPVTVAVNGVSSPTSIHSDPPGAVVIPIQTGFTPPPTSVTFFVAPDGSDAASGTLAAPFPPSNARGRRFRR